MNYFDKKKYATDAVAAGINAMTAAVAVFLLEERKDWKLFAILAGGGMLFYMWGKRWEQP